MGRSQRRRGLSPSFAKITRPRYTDVFPRERLFRLLDGTRHPVAWISAPPGAGKTTLISSYLGTRNIPHLWYQLDPGDDEPATFFHYLGLAVKDAAPRYRWPLPHLTAEYLAGLAVFARRYFEALAARFKPPFILVFDNYQDVSPGAALHAILCEGIAALPPGFTTIVLSRTPPPPEQARLRARDHLALLGWADLQLTLEEVIGIGRLNETAGRAVASYEELHRKTDGWAAGLVLLLAQGNAEHGTQLERDSPQVLFDYFAGEIFVKLDAKTRNVLLASALLPKMTASMAAQLTDFPAADRLLADLSQKNYFTLKHTHAEAVYEYHPLFREFLLTRAAQAFAPSQLNALQKKAAVLLEANGQIEHAAALLQQSGDWEGLARLSIEHAQGLIEQGCSQVLEGWLSSLPAEIHAANPWLPYWHGLCRLPFSPEQARAHFEQAYLRFKATGDLVGRCLAWCALVDSFVFEWGNFRPLDRWLAEMEELLSTQLPLANPEVEAQVACGMFLALMYRQPEHPDISQWERRVRRIILYGGDPRLQVKVGNHLLIYHTWWIGDLARAELLVDTLRAQIQQSDVAPLLQITWHTMAAGYYWMVAANAECIACVDRGLEIGRTSGVHVWDMLLCSQGVFASLSSGEIEVAARYLGHMETLLNSSRPMDTAMYYYLSAWSRLMQDNRGGAREFAKTAVFLAESAGARFPAAVMRNDLGRALFYLGDVEPGRALIAQAQAEGRAMGAQTIEYLTLIAEAEVAMQSGDEAACLAHLRRALTVGRAQQFQNHTWWSAEVMLRLYARALEHELEADYVRALIRKRRLPPPPEDFVPDTWPYPVKIRTLGPFVVLVDDKPLMFSTKAQKKPLELLKALVALGGKDVRQDRLAEILWPDAEADAADQALATTLHRLRRLIGEDGIEHKEGRFRLNARRCWVDVWALEQTLGALAQACLNRNTMKVSALAERALAVYRGTFLESEPDVAWTLSMRERLRAKLLRHVDEAARVLIEAGRPEQAIACYQRVLDIDPLTESCYRGLMQAYVAGGCRGEALATYERCCRVFQRELGIAPSPQTEALARQIKAA